MRILCLHSNKIKYEAVKKAIDDAEDIDKKSEEVDECLAVFLSVEEKDEEDVENVVDQMVKEVTNIAGKVNTDTIVLYPYVHLTANPGSPQTAVEVLDMAEDKLEDFTVYRSPFGWYKAFDIDVKGHPLAELSREFEPEKKESSVEESFSLKEKELNKKERIKLSSAAVVGKAIKDLFPEASLGSFDFYHDQAYIDVYGVSLKKEHLKNIEKKAKELVDEDLSFDKTDSVEGEFQEEILEDVEDVQAYALDDLSLVPLYENPFVKTTGEIGALKTLHLASAYWKGNSENPQLSRVYVVGFESQDELEEYQQKMKEAEERSHVNLGKQLNLFFNHDLAKGSPFFQPRGTVVLNEMENYLRELYFQEGYQEVRTPQVFQNELWKTSGHYDHFSDDMFFIEGEEKALKPMNCPSHCVIYNQQLHSYRDLPLRIADFGVLHRNELSGTLHGLTRVRKLEQDDAHIFCTQDQIKDEIAKLLKLINKVYEAFGLDDFSVELSTKPDKAMGSDEMWDQAESGLKEALDEAGYDFELNPKDGAFYGPKIDIHVTDSLDRSWQLGTVQLDFQMPKRFDLTYEGSDGKGHRPVMIHRALLGSLERFFGILIEHTKGNLPLWLNPVQVKVLTIADRHRDYAEEVVEELRSEGVRAELDDRMESVGKKVHDAQKEKANYILTIGDNEVNKETLAVRTRDGEETHGVKKETFYEEVKQRINNRS